MRILTVIVGSLIWFLLGAWQSESTSLPAPMELRWYTIEEVFQIKSEHPEDDKAIFVDVYTDWCGWCKRMDATTFQDPKIQAILAEEFYPVKFNGEAKRDIEVDGKVFSFVEQGRRGYHELAATLLQGKLSYPTLVLLDANANMIQPLPGYRQAGELLPILHFIGTEAYQTQSWESFSAEWQAAQQD